MKPSRLPTNPRKTARQERSRATVDAIVQATAYILAQFGWERLTTNAIAERAGVNISSLYQYFPNKEAIVSELQRRHIAETRKELSTILSDISAQSSLREALACLVESLVREHRIAPAIHRVFAEELPRSARSVPSDSDRVNNQMLTALQPFMKNVPDPRFAIDMVRVATHAIIHEAASHRPEILDRSDFVPEVVTFLESYLCRPAERNA